jgi:Domain of unknown function DUF11/LVIVD repeat
MPRWIHTLAGVRVCAGFLIAGLVLLPGVADAAEPPAAKSDNVSYVTTLDEPATVSARFQQRGARTLMFLSTLRGLSIYDVSDPEAPEKLGALDLPHFENEDVDVRGNFALISNDPSEGAGRLYVIDVSDPAAPVVRGSLATGTLDLYQGPIFNALGLIELPAEVTGGTGHTASFVDDDHVYLAGTAAGIDIVDVSNPDAPVKVGNFPAEEATGDVASHDVQFDQAGLAWIAGYGGTAAYDVSDPLDPQLVYETDAAGESTYVDDPTNDGSSLNDYIHHNSMRIPNGSLAAPPAGADPAADSDVVLITEEDYNRPTCAGAGSFETWRIGDDDKLHNLGRFDVEAGGTQALCSAHYFDERGGLVAQGFYEQGTRFLDISDPADVRQVGYWIPQENMTWGALYVPSDPSGEVVYALDNLRGIDVLRIDRPSEPAPPGDGGTPAAPPPGGLPPPAVVAPTATGAPDLSVRIADGRSRAQRGRQLRYRVRVRNHGTAAARNAIVRVRLPAAVEHLRGGTLRPRRTIRWRIVSLAAGKRRTLNLFVRVRPRASARLHAARERLGAGRAQPSRQPRARPQPAPAL